MLGRALTIFALSLLPALPLGASPAPVLSAAPAEDRDSTRLPFDPANNLIVITATLNGRGPFRFLLDTGASHHVMKPELARDLGLKVSGGGEVDAGGREKLDAALAQVAELRVGGFTLKGQRFFVVPFPPSYPFDGFLGAELFKRFVVSVDFRQSLVTLARRGAAPYRGPGVSLPLKFHAGLIPQVKAEVDDNTGWFKLDTGYNGSLALFGEFIEQHNLLGKYALRESGPGGQTLTGEVGDSPVARARRLKLGDLAIEDVPTTFFLEKGGLNSAFSGAIGTVILKRFHVTFDYKMRRVILERRGASASVP